MSGWAVRLAWAVAGAALALVPVEVLVWLLPTGPVAAALLGLLAGAIGVFHGLEHAEWRLDRRAQARLQDFEEHQNRLLEDQLSAWRDAH